MEEPLYLLGTPVIKKKKIREGVYAYKHESGVITIEGTRYFLQSMTEAIATFRRNNPLRIRKHGNS